MLSSLPAGAERKTYGDWLEAETAWASANRADELAQAEGYSQDGRGDGGQAVPGVCGNAEVDVGPRCVPIRRERMGSSPCAHGGIGYSPAAAPLPSGIVR